MIQHLAELLVTFVHTLGYFGIFLMTFLESTFVPVPSEVTMVPAGYLVHQGHLAFLPVLCLSVLGTVSGSYFNYWLAKHYGRRFLLKYGKYMLFKPERLAQIERYFASHGEISIFTGRLIPGVRHFISFPAGLAGMNLKRFCFFTGAGGGLWMFILILLGYAIGDNKALVKEFMPIITYAVLAFVVALAVVYVCTHRKKQMKDAV